jgi:hypothetical protein
MRHRLLDLLRRTAGTAHLRDEMAAQRAILA